MPEKELTLDDKLKGCDLEIQDHVSALKKEIRKLQKKNADMKVENISLKERVSYLESDEYVTKAYHNKLPKLDVDDYYNSIIEIINMNIEIEDRVREYLCK